MTKVLLPKAKILVGQSLHDIAINLQMIANIEKSFENGFVVYSNPDQSFFEDVLTEATIRTIVSEGGEVEGYIMYAALPFDVYSQQVPVGMPKSSMKVTTGSEIVSAQKTFAQWANADLAQTFSQDFQTIYVTTTPLGYAMKGSHIIQIADALNGTFITKQQYESLTVITE
jgi:hypothetical protein